MEKKQQLIKLWKTCFGDSDEFIQLFFDRVYEPENVLSIEEDGEIISALHAIPYTMTYFDSILSVSYIAGAATLPEKRGQGLMRQLIEKAFDHMCKQNIDIAALIPANKPLFDFYEAFGYTKVFDYNEETYFRTQSISNNLNSRIIPLDINTLENIYTYFNKKLMERPACILHSRKDFNTIVRDTFLSNGNVLISLNNRNKPNGVAFYTPTDENQIIVKELVYDNELIKTSLLHEIASLNKNAEIRYKTPANHSNAHPLGMAKILNKEKLIKLWISQYPDKASSIKELKKMNNQTLTSLIFDYSNKLAYMSLMLD